MQAGPIPAAQYLRMSTEHQQYSLLNQSDAIQRYADNHGLSIIKTYSDPAKSGVSIKKRTGLRTLLSDVVGRRAEYRVILVYDVSRWGRFQDNDESAFYEFICKQAGIPIHYCAETFENDGSMPSMIMKALKRSMAAEYSRELSVKVYEGQKRIAKLGYKSGGNPGYGLRRMAVACDGTHKNILGSGESKSMSTDRVKLVPGPPEEVECVREIFRLYTKCEWSAAQIASELNRRNVKALNGRAWSYWDIYGILHRPKYAGWAMYGRTAKKLYSPLVHNPPQEWVAVRSIEPIIDQATFDAAQRLFDLRNPSRASDERLINALRPLAKEGRLTSTMIKKASGVYSYEAYRKRFGSLKRVLELLGLPCNKRVNVLASKVRNETILNELVTRLSQLHATRSVVKTGYGRARLTLKNGSIVWVLTCHCELSCFSKQRWSIKSLAKEGRRPALLALFNQQNDDIESLYLVPHLKSRRKTICLTACHSLLQRGRRLQTLTNLSAELRLVRTSAAKRLRR